MFRKNLCRVSDPVVDNVDFRIDEIALEEFPHVNNLLPNLA